MKKIILAVALLLLTTHIWSNDFRFYSFGEFAYYPTKEDMFTSEEFMYFSTNIGVGVEWKFLFIDVNQEVDIVKSTSFYFSPYKEKYYVTAGINLWVLQIGYQHLCTHNVVSYNRRYGYFDQYDKIYINFDTRRLK